MVRPVPAEGGRRRLCVSPMGACCADTGKASWLMRRARCRSSEPAAGLSERQCAHRHSMPDARGMGRAALPTAGFTLPATHARRPPASLWSHGGVPCTAGPGEWMHNDSNLILDMLDSRTAGAAATSSDEQE